MGRQKTREWKAWQQNDGEGGKRGSGNEWRCSCSHIRYGLNIRRLKKKSNKLYKANASNRVLHDLTAQRCIQSASVSISSEPFYSMGAHMEAFRQTDNRSSSSNDGKNAETEAPTATDRDHFIGNRTNIFGFHNSNIW